MDLGIKGRKAIVCAASKGLGRGCAEALAEAGVDLVINARTAETLEQVAAELRDKYGVTVTAVAGDITDEAVRAQVLKAGEGADILVNNAGGPPPGIWSDWNREDFLKALDANLLTAVAMIRGRRDVGDRPRPPLWASLLQGVGVGLVTGTVGAGGGFLVVPALVLLGGLPMAAAVGTSLLVIAMNSAAGLAGHLHSVQLDWPFALAVTGTAVVGSVAGGLLAGRIPQERLRTVFGWFVLAMGVFVLGQSVLTA